ncbi:hypothetical protein COZ82_03950 [Candidatus Kaiserbacteria bacterium CG_4_8_14_3_um_filter_38_9]|uniref:Uncharacterized protein n=1 Tax=Candidatus Kaiserbacteria bacterium CG_4_8_14_3_um_filter_38_9 TaxID=1974599 RepID=A0A2M7IMQ8_9BACT|nr:MAG: hypothetical protein COZ82_03950 [Candidatus Kaiserbacteria bacterium CG_4_8_14_3_um_filter_38_9]
MQKPTKQKTLLLTTRTIPGAVLLAKGLNIHTLSVLRPNTVEYLAGSAVGIKIYEIGGVKFWRHVRYQDEAPLYQHIFSSIRHFRYGFALVVKQGKYFHIDPTGKAVYRWRFIDATDVRSDGMSLVQHPKMVGWHRFHVPSGCFADDWSNKK